jgi:hypothetical protein
MGGGGGGGGGRAVGLGPALAQPPSNDWRGSVCNQIMFWVGG